MLPLNKTDARLAKLIDTEDYRVVANSLYTISFVALDFLVI